MVSAGDCRKAACGFNFSFCPGRDITAESEQATCTGLTRSLNSPQHRRMFLRIYRKSEAGEVGEHATSEDRLLDFVEVL